MSFFLFLWKRLSAGNLTDDDSREPSFGVIFRVDISRGEISPTRQQRIMSRIAASYVLQALAGARRTQLRLLTFHWDTSDACPGKRRVVVDREPLLCCLNFNERACHRYAAVLIYSLYLYAAWHILCTWYAVAVAVVVFVNVLTWTHGHGPTVVQSVVTGHRTGSNITLEWNIEYCLRKHAYEGAEIWTREFVAARLHFERSTYVAV